jgi:hypothetical protein
VTYALGVTAWTPCLNRPLQLLLRGSNLGVRGWACGLNVGMYRDFVIDEVCLAKKQFAAHVAGSSITQIDTLPHRSPGVRRHLHGRYTRFRIAFGFGRIWLVIMNGRIFDIPLWIIIPFLLVALRVSFVSIHCYVLSSVKTRFFIWVQDLGSRSGFKLLLHSFSKDVRSSSGRRRTSSSLPHATLSRVSGESKKGGLLP